MMSPRISVQPKQKSPAYQYQPIGAVFYFGFRFLKEFIRKKTQIMSKLPWKSPRKALCWKSTYYLKVGPAQVGFSFGMGIDRFSCLWLNTRWDSGLCLECMLYETAYWAKQDAHLEEEHGTNTDWEKSIHVSYLRLTPGQRLIEYNLNRHVCTSKLLLLLFIFISWAV